MPKRTVGYRAKDGTETFLGIVLKNGTLNKAQILFLKIYYSILPKQALVMALKWLLPETYAHSIRVQRLSLDVGEKYNSLFNAKLSMRVLRSGALFHDIGKLLIPEETIKKKKLTRAEMRLLRRHPIFGALIAGKLFDSSVRNVILTHQEELNGSGYPKRLTKSHISLMSRIVSTVDDFCAMTEPRSYRRQLCEKDALAEIKKEIGSRYDPRIVQALRTTIGIES